MKMGKTLAITAASGILVGLLAGCGGESSSSGGSTTPTGAGSAAPADSAKTSCSGAAGGQKTSCSGNAAGASSAAPSKN